MVMWFICYYFLCESQVLFRQQETTNSQRFILSADFILCSDNGFRIKNAAGHLSLTAMNIDKN